MKHDEGPPESTKRIMLKPKDAPIFVKKNLEEFASQNSMNLFQRFGLLPVSFLSKSPTDWENLEEFNLCRDFFNKMAVTNDVAERGVALTQEYLPTLKTEAQKQNLLQTVNKYRAKFSKTDKTTLAQEF